MGEWIDGLWVESIPPSSKAIAVFVGLSKIRFPQGFEEHCRWFSGSLLQLPFMTPGLGNSERHSPTHATQGGASGRGLPPPCAVSLQIPKRSPRNLLS